MNNFVKIQTHSKKKITLDSIIYVILFIYIFFDTISSKSLLAYRFNLRLFRYCIYICKIILFAYFLYSNRSIRKKQSFELLLFLAVAFVTLWRVNSIFMDIFTVALTAKRDYKKTINAFFYSLVFSVLAIVCLDAIGLLPRYYTYRSDGMRRYTLGFNHPNNLAFLVVILVFLFVLKNGRKYGIFDHILTVCAAVFCYKVPNSLTSAMILLLFELIIIVQQLYQYLFKSEIINSNLMRKTIIILLPVCILVVYYIIFNLSQSFLLDVNGTIMSRINQSKIALNQYGFSIWGQEVNLVSQTAIYFGTVSSDTRFFAIDCLYVFLPVKYGIIPSLYFLYQYTRCMCIYMKKKNMVAFTIGISLIIFSLMETALLSTMMSFFFICAYASNYGESPNATKTWDGNMIKATRAYGVKNAHNI